MPAWCSYVTGDDASLEQIGPQVPSSSSRDHGEPFAAIFARYNHDFYAVDPHLFSPAEVVFQNLETGRGPRVRHGSIPEVLAGLSGLEPPILAMTTLVALVSGFGWHVDDLQRAAELLGVSTARGAIPEPLVPGFGCTIPGRGRHPRGRGHRPDRRGRRAGADDAAGKPGAGGLPDGCACIDSRPSGFPC